MGVLFLLWGKIFEHEVQKRVLQFLWEERTPGVDALSRLPLEDIPTSTPLPDDTVFMLELLESSGPITAVDIKAWTDKNPVLSRVWSCALRGNWDAFPQDDNFLPFRDRELELTIQNGCLLWDNRVVVPPPGRKKTWTCSMTPTQVSLA